MQLGVKNIAVFSHDRIDRLKWLNYINSVTKIHQLLDIYDLATVSEPRNTCW